MSDRKVNNITDDDGGEHLAVKPDNDELGISDPAKSTEWVDSM